MQERVTNHASPYTAKVCMLDALDVGNRRVAWLGGGDTHGPGAGSGEIEEEEVEVAVVVEAHAVVDPWAVVIHLQDAGFADGAMVRCARLGLVTF